MRRAVDVAPANVDWRYDLAVSSRRGADTPTPRGVPPRRGGRRRGGRRAGSISRSACGRSASSRRRSCAAERAAELAPGSAEALHNLGIIQDALGDRPGGDRDPGARGRCCNRIARSSQTISASRTRPRAELRCRRGVLRPGDSQPSRAGATAREPRRTYWRRADGFRQQKSCCAGSSRATPNNLAAFEALATTLLLAERSDEALVIVERGLAVAPDSTACRLRVGRIHHARRSISKLRSTRIREALRLDPDAPVARAQPGVRSPHVGPVRRGLARVSVAPPQDGRLPESARRPSSRPATRAARRPAHPPGRGLGARRRAVLSPVRSGAPGAGAPGSPTGVIPGCERCSNAPGSSRWCSGYEDEAPAADLVACVGDLPAILGDREGLPRPPPLRLQPRRQRVERLRAVLAALGAAAVPRRHLAGGTVRPTGSMPCASGRSSSTSTRRRSPPPSTESGATPVIVQRAPTAGRALRRVRRPARSTSRP